ncbi:M16 family metallopeptidase [Thalassiella azotivora]
MTSTEPTSGRTTGTAGQTDGATVRRTVLPGGVRVLTEHMPGLRSATIGAWVGVGSRDEADGHHGSTHFLEHLLFKGTARRDAMEIASAFDEVGGEANAATGKEYTCYYARVLDADLPMAVDVITDMVTSAVLDEDDVVSERGVILEELAMNEDDPADVVHEKFAELVLGDHPLGRPIGGTPQTIRDVPRQAIWEHYQQHYRPEGLVITAAGGVDHDVLCGLVTDALSVAGWPAQPGREPLPIRVHAGDSGPVAGPSGGGLRTVHRTTEQAHVMLGGLGLLATDERRFTMSVLNAVLGGGMSSRLFQEVREKRGLAYSVYSFAAGYSDSGYFGLYAGCAPARVAEVVDLLAAEWEKIAVDGITDVELARGTGQLAGGLVLGMEDTGSRMSRLGKAELVYGEFVDLDEALRRIRAVSADDVRALAAELASRPRSLVVVGPFTEDPVSRVP